MRNTLVVLTLIAAFGAAAPAYAEAVTESASAREIRVDKDAVLAVSGYDAVSYFDGKPLKGDRAFEALHHGIKFRFANAANKERFLADPDRFSPMNGGFCVVAASANKVLKANPQTYAIIDDRLVFSNNKKNLQKVIADPKKYGVTPRVVQ